MIIIIDKMARPLGGIEVDRGPKGLQHEPCVRRLEA